MTKQENCKSLTLFSSYKGSDNLSSYSNFYMLEMKRNYRMFVRKMRMKMVNRKDDS